MGKAAKSKPKKLNKPPPGFVPSEEQIAEALDYLSQGYAEEAVGQAMELGELDTKVVCETALSRIYFDPGRKGALLEMERLNNVLRGLYATSLGDDPIAAATAAKSLVHVEARRATVMLSLVPETSRVFDRDHLLTLAGLDPIEDLEEGKPGRPEHQVTVINAARVDAWAMTGMPRETMAHLLGISKNTLAKHYGNIITTAKQRLIAEMGGLVISSARKKALEGDTRDAWEVLDRKGGEEWQPSEYNGRGRTGGGAEKLKVDAAGAIERHEIVVSGGLPEGSTPENPAGTARPEDAP